MSTRDEVLTVESIIDRIRELEAQQALPPIREKFVRVSDELVAELKAAPSKPVTVAIVEDGNELHMTFREAPQAASEPVAWADRLADAVRKLVRVLNDGDDVSALVLALEATEKALAQFDDSKRCCGLCDAGECKYEIAHPSAAGVTVTQHDEKITMTVGPVTEDEAVAALKRHGWTEQASLFGSFRSLVAPEPAASEGASA